MADEKEKTVEELADEAAAALTDEETTAEETTAEEKPKEAAPAPNVDQVVQKLAEVLKPGMTEEQKEAQIARIEKESGFTRQQLGFMTTTIRQTATQMNLGVSRELGKAKAEKILGAASPKLIAKVEEEMNKLAPEHQANPEAWEQMAFLTRGKHMDVVLSTTTTDGGDKRMPGLTEPKKGGGSPAPSKKKEYNQDEQTIINQYFEGKPEEYEKAKATKKINTVSKFDGGGNAADRELHRLTGGQGV